MPEQAPRTVMPAPARQASPRKRWPTFAIVIGGLFVVCVVGLLLLMGIGAFVSNRATPTPTVQPSPTLAASARQAVVAAKPTASPAPTAPPRPTPVPSPTRVPISLENGTEITPPVPGPAGLGKLTIKNGTSRDAVAKLVIGDEDPKTWQTHRFVYVKANNTLVMEGIPAGTYRLAFMSGVDWDTDSRKFLREVSTSLFDDTFEFVEERTERGIRFSTMEVTLNPVAGGTATTSALPEGAFGPE